MAQRESLWIAGLKAVGGAVIATLAVRWLGVTVLTIPPEFLPLAGPGPTASAAPRLRRPPAGS